MLLLPTYDCDKREIQGNTDRGHNLTIIYAIFLEVLERRKKNFAVGVLSRNNDTTRNINIMIKNLLISEKPYT